MPISSCWAGPVSGLFQSLEVHLSQNGLSLARQARCRRL
jgi:hypothetical protein